MASTSEPDRQKIDRLASTLKGLQQNGTLTLDQLDVWTELAYFLCPERLNNSSTSNDEIFTAFENQLKSRWTDQELQASILLLYSISVQCTVGTSSRRGKLDTDDSLGDAIEMRAFQFIHSKILQIHKFHEYLGAVELIDMFIKQFIIHCPNRLQEIFAVCEEELCCIEDFEANPSQYDGFQIDKYPLHFKTLLNIIKQLYEGQTPQLINLAKQYFSSDYEHLGHFIRSIVSISSPVLYVAYVEMLESLCKSQSCASFLLRHFNSNHEMLYDWAGLFGTLRRYVEVFRRKVPINHGQLQTEVDPPQTMRHQDLIATISWIRLATAISKHDHEALRFFVFGNHFNSVDILVSAITSFMPVRLKGEIFKLLAVLAADENSAVQIWNVLIRDAVCVFGDKPGRLIGIQVEFEDLECVNRVYDSALGFLHLVRSLFSNRYLPDSTVIAPYVFFVTKSIICQCDSRSYENIQQMWDMLDIAFDCLFQFLRRFHISASTVSKRTPQIFVLAQLLSDSDLSRAMVRILSECANRLPEMFSVLEQVEHTEDYPIVLARNNAAKSALRLLSYAINLHSTLRASLRASVGSTSLFIAPLESILLTPLSSSTSNQQNYIQMLSTFLDEQEILLPHTYYIVRILRKLASKPNAEIQNVLLRTFQAIPSAKWIFARLMFIKSNEKPTTTQKSKDASYTARDIEVSDQDTVSFDLHGVQFKRLCGEVAREVIELFIEVMEMASRQPNIAYELFGFDSSAFQLTKAIKMEEESDAFNCMKSLVELINLLCSENEPYKLSYSALFDPALQLLGKFCNVNSLSSEPILRFLRNDSNLIRRLTQSTVFQAAHEDVPKEHFDNEEEVDNNVSVHLTTFNRQIRGLILQLVAVDFTVSMNLGHVGIANEYLAILLGTGDENRQAVLWSLMYNSISASLEIKTPVYRNFEMNRVEGVLESCLRSDFSGVQEYDVEMVHFILNKEIGSIINCDVSDIQQEANEILLYCVQYNAQKRLEGSCLQVLSAWVAFINAVVFFAPLPFLDFEMQEQIFNDALIVLKDYLESITINKEVLSGMSNCIFSLVRCLVKFACLKSTVEHERKIALGPILVTLIHCLTLPGYNRYTRFKMDIYAAILCLIEACAEQSTKNDKNAIESYLQTGSTKNGSTKQGQNGDSYDGGQLYDSIVKPYEDSLEGVLQRRNEIVQGWTSIFKEHSEEIFRICALDIDYAPLTQKTLAMTCFAEIVHEGRTNSDILQQVRKISVIKLVLDSLNINVNVNFADRLHDNKTPLSYLRAFLNLLFRIANCRGGINLLTDCGVTTQLDKFMAGLQKDAPKDFSELTDIIVFFDLFKNRMLLKSL